MTTYIMNTSHLEGFGTCRLLTDVLKWMKNLCNCKGRSNNDMVSSLWQAKCKRKVSG
jgi:hypothetical protein